MQLSIGLGEEACNGEIPKKDKVLLDSLVKLIKDCLVNAETPHVWKEGRLILLSKTGEGIVELENARPIVA